ncbi:MAG TPA: hypothetical protein VFZ21_26060 [Gemmatimonadaceae bacterium]|nr:hypothetical protein [Gemmatimonadaceae bacterium]
MPRVVVAWFGKHKQWWHYEIFDGYQAHLGMVWRDGEQNPKSPK